jgi:hypothetical protein
MKRKLLIAVGALVAAFIAATVFLVSRIDSLVTKAINTYGPEITGTEVRTDDVRVSFLSGEATVKNFFLGNPKGYRSAHAVRAASITVRLELGSLPGDTIIVKRIEVIQPDVIYEKRDGTDNFQTIAMHAEQKAKEAGLAGEDSGGAA